MSSFHKPGRANRSSSFVANPGGSDMTTNPTLVISTDTEQLSNGKVTALNHALEQIRAILIDGLHHGFFDCAIRSEIGKNNRREMFVGSGKSHKFIIPAEDLRG